MKERATVNELFPRTRARVAEWAAREDVLGVLLVGSKSRGHGDALSDDDLEVLLTDEAFARISPVDCSEVEYVGEGASRRLIYDAEYTSLADLRQKADSPRDLDHWPYERAVVLFERDDSVRAAVEAAAKMAVDFRRLRLLHATIDAWAAPRRAAKTFGRGMESAGRAIVARGAKALSRVMFALEWRWTPLDHWLEPELRTLADEAGVAQFLLEALAAGRHEPLAEALNRLEERLYAEGVARSPDRLALFLELIHPTRAAERLAHGLY